MDDSQGHKGMIQIQKKNNFSINISKGGGIGIGVGIILVGGAFLLNSFHNKPPKKPIKNNHEDHHSSTPENTYDDQHLISDETDEPTGSGNSSEISGKKVLQDGNHKFEPSHGFNDDQEIISCAKDSENQTMEYCNGFVAETEQLSSSSTITVCGIDSQVTGEEEDGVTMLSSNEVNSELIDHDDQERGRNADTAIHGEDDDLIALESIEDSKVSEIPEEASEEVDTTILSSIEVNSDLIDHDDQESDSNADTAKHGEDDEFLNIKSIEDSKIFEIPVVQEAQHEVQLDGEIDVQDSSNGLLTTSDVGVLDKSELLEKPKIEQEPETPNFEEKEAEFEAETNAALESIEENKALFHAAGEAAEEEEIQHDVQTKEAAEIINSSIEHTSKLIEQQIIEEAIDDKEEKDIDVEIESKVEHTNKLMECQVIEEAIEDTKEKRAQDDVHINAAEINSGSKKSNEFETILDQDLKHASHQITSDNISPQENDQHISLSELTTPPELNPTMGLKNESKDVGMDLLTTEKDIIFQEIDALSQAVIVDNVEETEKSVPMQVKDETEKLQETEKEIHYKQIEDVAISSDNNQTLNIEKDIEKEVSNPNLFKKYMVKLAQQNRKRSPIVIGTISALLPLCYSYFGLPFLKIFLIALFVMLLSKIQGF